MKVNKRHLFSTSMSLSNKRKLSPQHSPRVSKRAHYETAIDVDADDLTEILARIKEQEESERLAKRLQDEWMEPEDDEALAKRLALEWEQEDKAASTGDAGFASGLKNCRETDDSLSIRASASTTHSSNTNDLTPPDDILRQFRPLFTQERPCSECGKLVASPRGHVSLHIFLCQRC